MNPVEAIPWMVGASSGATSLFPVEGPRGVSVGSRTRHHTYSAFRGASARVMFDATNSTPPELRVDWWQEALDAEAIAHIVDTVSDLRALPAKWDGHDAKRLTDAAVIATITIATQLARKDLLAPQIFPLPDGGMQLEWHVFGNSLEIEIDGSGSPFGASVDAQGNLAWEKEFTPDDRKAITALEGMVMNLTMLIRGTVIP